MAYLTKGSPLRVLMHALRLGEGPHQHLGGNFHHVAYLGKALAARDDIELMLLADRASYAPLCAVVGSRHVLLADYDAGQPLSVLEADRLLIRYCRELNPDVYHRPTGQLPFSRLPCPTITTVADLNFRTLPTPLIKRLYKEISYRWTIRVADRITCISEYTKSELIRHMGAAPEKLKVIHHGTNELPEADFSLANSIGRPFWMTFGHQKHKNVETCLDIMRGRRAGAGNNDGEILVVVGQSEHLDKNVRPEVERLGLTDVIKFVGRIDAPNLHGLYRTALGLLFLSKYEGFGLPVLEAMGCGCPVISSNVCSLPEVAGDAAYLIAPTDIEGASRAMTELISGGEIRQARITAGKVRAAEFSWERAAFETVQVYRSLLSPVQ